jgi:hypothetical protein
VISVRTLEGPEGPEFTVVSIGVSDRLTTCARLTRGLRVVVIWTVTDGKSVLVHLCTLMW